MLNQRDIGMAQTSEMLHVNIVFFLCETGFFKSMI